MTQTAERVQIEIELLNPELSNLGKFTHTVDGWLTIYFRSATEARAIFSTLYPGEALEITAPIEFGTDLTELTLEAIASAEEKGRDWHRRIMSRRSQH